MERLTKCVGIANGKPIYTTNIDMRKLGSADKLKNALGEYEDLEEQGKLLKLPCKIGDAVYTLNTLPSGKTVIGELEADAFFCALCFLEGRFGKTVFLTREEAENVLNKRSVEAEKLKNEREKLELEKMEVQNQLKDNSA